MASLMIIQGAVGAGAAGFIDNPRRRRCSASLNYTEQPIFHDLFMAAAPCLVYNPSRNANFREPVRLRKCVSSGAQLFVCGNASAEATRSGLHGAANNRIRGDSDSSRFRSWGASKISSRSSVIRARGQAYHTNPRFLSRLAMSSRRNLHVSRLKKMSASIEEGVETSETGSIEGSNSQKIESSPPSTSDPFAKGKISSRIAAKKAVEGKIPVSASTAQKAAPLKTPVPTVQQQQPKSQLSANAASQLKVSRPPSVFNIPTRPGDEKPVSPILKPAASKPDVIVNPFLKRPMVPPDWEKAGARPAGSGKKVLDAFKAGEKQGITTKFGQPVVPTDIFNEKRRTPEEVAADAFKFEISAGQLFLAGSFLVIIVVMLSTAFLVWKLGGIHYNDQ